MQGDCDDGYACVYPTAPNCGVAYCCTVDGKRQRHGRQSQLPTRSDALLRAGPQPIADRRHVDGGLSGPMIDLVFIVVTVAFFALAVGYARACDRM